MLNQCYKIRLYCYYFWANYLTSSYITGVTTLIKYLI